MSTELQRTIALLEKQRDEFKDSMARWASNDARHSFAAGTLRQHEDQIERAKQQLQKQGAR